MIQKPYCLTNDSLSKMTTPIYHQPVNRIPPLFSTKHRDFILVIRIITIVLQLDTSPDSQTLFIAYLQSFIRDTSHEVHYTQPG